MNSVNSDEENLIERDAVVVELFGWRRFFNRRQLAGMLETGVSYNVDVIKPLAGRRHTAVGGAGRSAYTRDLQGSIRRQAWLPKPATR